MSEFNTRNVCRYIFLLNAKIDHLAEFETEEGRVTREQLYIIEMVAEDPGITQKTLVKHLKKRQTSTSRAIQKLVMAGYLTKKQNSSDMRASYLTITEKGQKLLEELEEPICSLTDDILEKLDKEEQKSLTKILEKIHK